MYVAAGSNQEHRGLKLTNADKRRAVEMLLGTSYSKWGNEKIGEYIGVSGAFVAKIKDSAPEQTQHSDPRHHQTFNGDDGQNDVDENKKEGRDGKFYSPRRQARTASPPATTSPQSIDGGDWKYVQLAEFLEAEDYIWEALAERKITTAGQLFDALNSGQDPGIQHVDREALRKQVEQFANAKESEPYETPAFDWKKYESSFGPVIRGLEQLTRAFPIPKTEHDLAKDLLTKYLLLFGTWKTEYRGR